MTRAIDLPCPAHEAPIGLPCFLSMRVCQTRCTAAAKATRDANREARVLRRSLDR